MAKNKSSGANAYDMLLSAIECGDLPPGARLREVELADRFGISRTPIREALKQLEAQGLVSHEPHHGSVVSTIDYSAHAEMYLLREVLEGTAARLAAIHATQTEIDVLFEMVDHDRSILGDSKKLAGRNRLFHHQLHLASRNRYLISVLMNMRVSMVLLAGSTLAVPGRSAEAVEEHAKIVDAIAQHDADAAEKFAREHMRNAYKTRIKMGLISPT